MQPMGTGNEHAAPSDPTVPMWMRTTVVVLLAVPQLLTGLWAVVRPAGWFADFPGIGPALVAAEPPFNRHLATDAGAGFLAIGVCLAVASYLGKRSAMCLSLLTYLGLEVPHAVYHLTHRADALSGAEEVASAGGILFGVVLALAFLWLLRAGVSPVRRVGSSESRTAGSTTAPPA